VRVLLDECLPRRLKRELVGHDVSTAPEMGWGSKRNGDCSGWRWATAGGGPVRSIPHRGSQSVVSTGSVVIRYCSCGARCTQQPLSRPPFTKAANGPTSCWCRPAPDSFALRAAVTLRTGFKPIAGGRERGAPRRAAGPSPVTVLVGPRTPWGCSRTGPAPDTVLKPVLISTLLSTLRAASPAHR
jgi:hypothetical protein